MIPNPPVFILPSDHEPPTTQNLILKTTTGNVIVGKWGQDCVAWYPLPVDGKPSHQEAR